MKKGIYIIAVLALMTACSGGSNKSDEASEKMIKQTEAIEKSVENLDETIKSSDMKMEKTQSEIDTLLNDI